MRQRRTARHESNPDRDQDDSKPAGRSHLLMQQKLGDESQQNIPDRRGWKDICQVGPGESGHVSGKESEQKKYSGEDPSIQYRQNQIWKLMEGAFTRIFHFTV